MKPLWIKPLESGEIEITISTREGAKPVHMEDSEVDRLINEPDYKKLQVELQEKYGFLFKDKIRKVLGND